ncbi:hypothetical protein ACFL6C_12760, partial [Myxococcota bacterium]
TDFDFNLSVLEYSLASKEVREKNHGTVNVNGKNMEIEQPAAQFNQIRNSDFAGVDSNFDIQAFHASIDKMPFKTAFVINFSQETSDLNKSEADSVVGSARALGADVDALEYGKAKDAWTKFKRWLPLVETDYGKGSMHMAGLWDLKDIRTAIMSSGDKAFDTALKTTCAGMEISTPVTLEQVAAVHLGNMKDKELAMALVEAMYHIDTDRMKFAATTDGVFDPAKHTNKEAALWESINWAKAQRQ